MTKITMKLRFKQIRSCTRDRCTGSIDGDIFDYSDGLRDSGKLIWLYLNDDPYKLDLIESITIDLTRFNKGEHVLHPIYHHCSLLLKQYLDYEIS